MPNWPEIVILQKILDILVLDILPPTRKNDRFTDFSHYLFLNSCLLKVQFRFKIMRKW
jgi:hypothetical protein